MSRFGANNHTVAAGTDTHAQILPRRRRSTTNLRVASIADGRSSGFAAQAFELPKHNVSSSSAVAMTAKVRGARAAA